MHSLRMPSPTVVKLGGQLLEDAALVRRISRRLLKISSTEPLVVVHGGGQEVNTELLRLGIPIRKVDGLRVTNLDTLDIVVGILAGRINTRLVAALNAVGGSAVGLTGADDGLTRIRRLKKYKDTKGNSIDPGFVGRPTGDLHSDLIRDLCNKRYVPVVASVGANAKGQLFNVNADSFAGHLATALRAKRLIIAGTTAGVLDAKGRTIPTVDKSAITDLIRDGQVNTGMIAKLLACQSARSRGVSSVAIVDGRAASFDRTAGTMIEKTKHKRTNE